MIIIPIIIIIVSSTLITGLVTYYVTKSKYETNQYTESLNHYYSMYDTINNLNISEIEKIMIAKTYINKTNNKLQKQFVVKCVQQINS